MKSIVIEPVSGELWRAVVIDVERVCIDEVREGAPGEVMVWAEGRAGEVNEKRRRARAGRR